MFIMLIIRIIELTVEINPSFSPIKLAYLNVMKHTPVFRESIGSCVSVRITKLVSRSVPFERIRVLMNLNKLTLE